MNIFLGDFVCNFHKSFYRSYRQYPKKIFDSPLNFKSSQCLVDFCDLSLPGFSSRLNAEVGVAATLWSQCDCFAFTPFTGIQSRGNEPIQTWHKKFSAKSQIFLFWSLTFWYQSIFANGHLLAVKMLFNRRPMTYDNYSIPSIHFRHIALKTTFHELRWTKMN